MTTESSGAVPGEQKTPAQQRAILEGLLRKYESAEQPDPVTGQHIPAGSPGEPDSLENMDFAPFVAGAFSFVFDVVADRAGEHWRLNDRECKEIGDKGGAYIETMTGRIEMTTGWSLAVTAGVIFAPRLLAHRKIKKEKAKEQPQKREPETGEAETVDFYKDFD